MASHVIHEELGYDDWLQKIADKAKRPVDQVRVVLGKNGIRPKPSLAIPKRLLITSLAFTGRKRGTSGDAVINFNQSFDTGLWAFVSTRNSRGKTTILDIMRWCLTGRRYVDPIMKDWFDTISLKFQLDGRDFEVKIDDAINCTGALLRSDKDAVRIVHQFHSDAEFENVMSAYFMGELSLQEIVNHVAIGESGADQVHGWPWLASAMIIEANPKATFGNVHTAAMPTRMMQMYLGISWSNTTNDIMAAKARYRSETRQNESFTSRFRTQADGRVSELNVLLGERRDELRELPADGDVRASLVTANSKFAEAEDRDRKLLLMLGEAMNDEHAADEAYIEARRALRAFKDGIDAGFVFRALNPTCCPRCDEVFSEERGRQRSEARICFVCDTPEIAGDIDVDEEQALKDAVSKADEVRTSARLQREAIQNKRTQAQADKTAAEAECMGLQERLAAPSKRGEIETAIIRLEAQIEELQRSFVPESRIDDDDVAILNAAETVTKKAFEPNQKAVLADMSSEAKRYAEAFGIEHLDSIEINGAMHFNLSIAGKSANFGDRSPGIKMRLKLAATLAIIKVAHEKGVGRHPGLLIIDSPGGAEMVPVDYEKVIAGFAQLADDLRHLQVFVAAIDHPIITDRVSCNKMVKAEGEAYLW